jgi:hypothetical protein
LVTHRFPPKSVRLDPKLYRDLREVSEAALRKTPNPRFSPRLKSRAVRLGAASALLTYFAHERDETIPIGDREAIFARRFYEEEIRAREGRRGAAN